jgi:SPOC domain
MLSRHYYQAAASWVVFFAPGSDADIASYNDFMQYLTEKQRVAVAKLEEKVSLFLVPPSDFTEKVLKVPGKLSISGLILRFNQQMDTDQDPGLTFNQPATKPGRRIEESSVYKVHDSPDFRSQDGPSSGSFTPANFSSGFTLPYLPPNSIQQQSHGPGALGFAPQPPLNPIQQQIQEPSSSGFVPQPPNPVQQQAHEVGTSGFAPQALPNPLQQLNFVQGPSFQRLPPPNPHQQQNSEQSPMGFQYPLPPNSTQQQNLEPYTSGFQLQPPSNPTWQQTHHGYSPFQNNNLSGNFQLRPELSSNYMTTPPPLPLGPPPLRAAVPPSVSQPVSMQFQFGTNFPSYEQGGLEQIQNQNTNLYPNPNPNSNVNSMMNSVPLPSSYTSQAHPVMPGIWGPSVSQGITSVPPAMQQQQQMGGAVTVPPAVQQVSGGATVHPSVQQQHQLGGATVPPAVQQQQQGGGASGAGGENATDTEQQKRLQATMQLAAVLLQRMQQQASTGTDRQ